MKREFFQKSICGISRKGFINPDFSPGWVNSGGALITWDYQACRHMATRNLDTGLKNEIQIRNIQDIRNSDKLDRIRTPEINQDIAA